MKDLILVRNPPIGWYVFLIVLGVILWGISVPVALGGKEMTAAAILFVVGAVGVVGGIFGINYQRRQRLWVEVLESGFIVSDRNGERPIADAQVVSMTLIHKGNYSAGILSSTTRNFLVWVATDDVRPEPITMTNTFARNIEDPLAALIRRIGDLLFDQANKDWQAGQSVLGEHWVLKGSEVTVRMGKTTVEIPVADLTAVALVDRNVSLWRKDQDEAAAKVPIASANAHILWRLLEEHLKAHPPADRPPEDGRLGRILFERKPSSGGVFICWLMAFACLLVGGFGAVGAVIAKDYGLAMVLFLVLCGTAGFVWAGLRQGRAVFRCHEYGVHKQGMFGPRTLRYADVDKFTYNAVRHFYNGAYTGTQFTFHFTPVPEKKQDQISYAVMLQNADGELDNLRDQIARMIAGRMWRQLQAKQPVRWTANLRFLPEGIEYRPSGFLGRKEPVVLPYSAISSFNIEKGTFHVWERGTKKSVIQEQMSQPNFFPGFVLLSMMSEAPAAG